jgi:hypothetical protein
MEVFPGTNYADRSFHPNRRGDLRIDQSDNRPVEKPGVSGRTSGHDQQCLDYLCL